MKRVHIFLVTFVLLLPGLAFANILVFDSLFNPLGRGSVGPSLLGDLAPAVPFSGGFNFPRVLSPDDASGSGSSVVINSSSLAMGVYGGASSSGHPQPLSSIDWSAEGPIIPGQSRSSPLVYLKNEGDKSVSLSLSTSNWVFRDSKGALLGGDYRLFFSLSWDYDYSSVAVGEVRPVIFTLSVLPGLTDVSTFSFDLVITLTD